MSQSVLSTSWMRLVCVTDLATTETSIQTVSNLYTSLFLQTHLHRERGDTHN